MAVTIKIIAVIITTVNNTSSAQKDIKRVQSRSHNAVTLALTRAAPSVSLDYQQCFAFFYTKRMQVIETRRSRPRRL